MSFAHIPSQIQIGANKFGIEKFLKIKLVQVLVKHPLECLDNTLGPLNPKIFLRYCSRLKRT